MNRKLRRPAAGPGAEGTTVFWEDSESKFDYTNPCSCHITKPCQTCRGWAENYRSIRAAKAALGAITARQSLRLVRGGRS
jgi:hypothetical protein